MVICTPSVNITASETLHEKKVRAGHLGGRPRSLTFDEMLTKGLIDTKLFKPLGALYKNIERKGGSPQLNIGGVKAGVDVLHVSNNLSHLKRLARRQINEVGW